MSRKSQDPAGLFGVCLIWEVFLVKQSYQNLEKIEKNVHFHGPVWMFEKLRKLHFWNSILDTSRKTPRISPLERQEYLCLCEGRPLGPVGTEGAIDCALETQELEELERQFSRTRMPPFFSPADSFGVSAQIGSGVVRGGPEVRFHEGSTRVPPGFHQVPRGCHEGSTRFCEGCGVPHAVGDIT